MEIDDKRLHKSVIQKIVEVAEQDVGALQLPLLHHFKTQGKGSRTSLIASMQAKHVVLEDLVAVCAACECIHEASLVHDDLQDRDRTRRNAPTVWHKFSDDAAILLGDHLIACASKILIGSNLPDGLKLDIINTLSQAVSNATNGQLTQLNLEIDHPAAIEFYEDSAANKTGAFFAMPLKAAFALRYYSINQFYNRETDFSCPKYQGSLSQLDKIGRNLGIGYQIYNDCKELVNGRGFFASRDWQQQLVTAPLLVINRLSDLPIEEPLSRSFRERVIAECIDWQEQSYQRATNQLMKLESAARASVVDFSTRFKLKLPETKINSHVTTA
ncbi:MAG: polyprenyl synthetase family protein [Pseudomonadota bacterium]